MSTILVRPILPGYQTLGLPVGSVIHIWGYQFTVNKEKILTCEMQENVAKGEIKAGRVVRCEPIAEAKPEVVKQPNVVDEFSGNASNYFGIEDKQKFEKKLGRLKLVELYEFTERFFNFNWPEDMSKAEIITNLLKAIEDLRE
jgi:hypothetical protein